MAHRLELQDEEVDRLKKVRKGIAVLQMRSTHSGEYSESAVVPNKGVLCWIWRHSDAGLLVGGDLAAS